MTGLVQDLRYAFRGLRNSPRSTVLLGAWMLLKIVALAAVYLPARRAARVDPMEALRYE